MRSAARKRHHFDVRERLLLTNVLPQPTAVLHIRILRVKSKVSTEFEKKRYQTFNSALSVTIVHTDKRIFICLVSEMVMKNDFLQHNKRQGIRKLRRVCQS